MDSADLIEDWILTENPITKTLLPIRRISIKNYLLNSIRPYTREELLKIRKEEFLQKYGGDEGIKKFINDYEKDNNDTILDEAKGIDLECVKRGLFEDFIEKDYIKYNYEEFDSYDYTSQKLAVELLEKFNQYRQVISLFDEHTKEPRSFHIEVEFIDNRNVSRFQAIYNINSKILVPDTLNDNGISKIEERNKVPVIPLKELKKILPLKNKIAFYRIDIIHKQKLDCYPFVELEFNDIKGKKYILTLSDCAFILFDSKKHPYRCFPIHEIIKPYLEKMNFSKCKDTFFSDLEAHGHFDTFDPKQRSLPNRLKHYYNDGEKIIFLQICGSDRSDRDVYKYFVYDITIKLNKDIIVEIRKNEDDNFYWRYEER